MKLPLCLLLFSVLGVFVQPTFALRSPPALAINSESKQCLMYWPGERRSLTVLPKGWLGFQAVGKVKTSQGDCEFNNEPGDAEKCCKSLGLEYIPAKDVMSVLRPARKS